MSLNHLMTDPDCHSHCPPPPPIPMRAPGNFSKRSPRLDDFQRVRRSICPRGMPSSAESRSSPAFFPASRISWKFHFARVRDFGAPILSLFGHVDNQSRQAEPYAG